MRERDREIPWRKGGKIAYYIFPALLISPYCFCLRPCNSQIIYVISFTPFLMCVYVYEYITHALCTLKKFVSISNFKICFGK